MAQEKKAQLPTLLNDNTRTTAGVGQVRGGFDEFVAGQEPWVFDQTLNLVVPYHLAANPKGLPMAAADGGLATLGAKADAAVVDPALSASEIALLKGLLKQLQGTGSGSAPVTLNGSVPAGTNDIGKVQLFVTSETCSAAPVTGAKTVTATAAEIFAGASVKANRRKLIVKNEDPALRFRVGPSSVTQQNGFPVEPGATLELVFDPAVVVPVYAVAEGADLSVAVMEI